MKRVGDFWWPDVDEDAHGVILKDVGPAIAGLLPHVKGRDTIVQAGANVGVYPIELAAHFEEVHTVEPDPANYECLKENCYVGAPNVFYEQAAFGESPWVCEMDRFNPKNCGAHRIHESEDATIPVITIDSLALQACDAIWLDVEGFELPALKGAIDTILKFSPVIMVEEKDLGAHYGIGPDDIQTFLSGLGYERIERHGNDWIYKRGNQP